MGKLLHENGDLLVYGCESGKGTAGQRFIEALANYTGADVAASNDVTYSNLLTRASDWVLEEQFGAIEANQDVLTGLNWQGQLGSTASISGSELKIINASGAIGISRNTTGIVLTGTTQTSLTAADTKVFNKVSVTGNNYEISGINLDWNSTDTTYPNPYDVVLNATGSYAAGSTANSGDLTVSGPIRSFGGNVSLSSPGKVSIRSTNSNAITALIDARTWSGSTATTTAGNLTINFKSEGRDLPLLLWMPQVDVNLEVGNTTGTGKTQLFANDVTINGSASIASDFIANSSSN